jgi:hypothetical protein
VGQPSPRSPAIALVVDVRLAVEGVVVALLIVVLLVVVLLVVLLLVVLLLVVHLAVKPATARQWAAWRPLAAVVLGREARHDQPPARWPSAALPCHLGRRGRLEVHPRAWQRLPGPSAASWGAARAVAGPIRRDRPTRPPGVAMADGAGRVDDDRHGVAPSAVSLATTSASRSGGSLARICSAICSASGEVVELPVFPGVVSSPVTPTS